jgi:signal transduction histidine kinase
LAITLKKREDSVLLTITDNGIEVTQNDLPHLFDRFYRADSSRGKQQGSGLGLSIARQLVHLHEGKIWIAINPTGGLAVNILMDSDS